MRTALAGTGGGHQKQKSSTWEPGKASGLDRGVQIVFSDSMDPITRDCERRMSLKKEQNSGGKKPNKQKGKASGKSNGKQKLQQTE
jgi:hypothetical protein